MGSEHFETRIFLKSISIDERRNGTAPIQIKCCTNATIEALCVRVYDTAIKITTGQGHEHEDLTPPTSSNRREEE